MQNLLLIGALLMLNMTLSFAQNCGSENLNPNSAQSPTLRNMGQSFTLCSNETITSISIQRKKSPGTEADRQGTLWIFKGETVDAPETAIHTQEITMSAINEAVETVTFNLNKGVSCQANTTYTFYFELKMVKDNALILISGNGQNPYAGGNAFYEKNAKGGSDFWFQLGIEEKITLYKTSDFTGESLSITKDWFYQDTPESRAWNDATHSIRVPAGWEIMLYGGKFDGGVTGPVNSDWVYKTGDKCGGISSIKILKNNKIVLYKTSDFTGESLEITEDWFYQDTPESRKWNDAVRSIKVPAGWEIMLYGGKFDGGVTGPVNSDWVYKTGDKCGGISSIKILKKN